MFYTTLVSPIFKKIAFAIWGTGNQETSDLSIALMNKICGLDLMSTNTSCTGLSNKQMLMVQSKLNNFIEIAGIDTCEELTKDILSCIENAVGLALESSVRKFNLNCYDHAFKALLIEGLSTTLKITSVLAGIAAIAGGAYYAYQAYNANDAQEEQMEIPSKKI